MPSFTKETILTNPASENNISKIIYDVFIKGALERTWQVVSGTPNKLRLKIVVRNKHSVVIDINDNNVPIDDVESINMDYDKNLDGVITIHFDYVNELIIC